MGGRISRAFRRKSFHTVPQEEDLIEGWPLSVKSSNFAWKSVVMHKNDESGITLISGKQSLELFPSQIVEIFDEGPYVVLVRVRGPVIELWKPRADEEAVDFKNWLVNQLDESISIKTR